MNKHQYKAMNHEELIEAGKNYLRQLEWDRRYQKKHGIHPMEHPDKEVRLKTWEAVHRWGRAIERVGVANIVRAFEATRPK